MQRGFAPVLYRPEIRNTAYPGGEDTVDNKKPLCVHIPIPFAQRPCLLNAKNSILDIDLGTRKAYVRAMQRELVAAAQDMDDYEVAGIVFDTGAIQQFRADEAAELVRVIREHLTMAERPAVVLACDVDSLDEQKCACYREMGVTMMDVRLFTSVMDEARAINRSCPHFTLKEPAEILHKYGIEHIGVQVAAGLRGQDENSLMMTLQDCVEHDAVHVTVIERSGGQALARCADAFLTEHGYVCYAPGMYARAGWEMAFYPPGRTDVLALGIGAESRMEGVLCRNTRNMKLYIRAAHDYTMITESVEEIKGMPNS